MSVNKGKNTNIFFLCCIMRNLQKNFNFQGTLNFQTTPTPPRFTLPPPFSGKTFQKRPPPPPPPHTHTHTQFLSILSKPTMLSNEVFVNNDKGLQMFCQLSINILNKHAPRKNKTKKKKYARGNQMPFLTKKLSREIMTRSKLRSNYPLNTGTKKIKPSM